MVGVKEGETDGHKSPSESLGFRENCKPNGLRLRGIDAVHSSVPFVTR